MGGSGCMLSTKLLKKGAKRLPFTILTPASNHPKYKSDSVNKNKDLDDTNLSKAEHCKNTRCVLKMRGKKKRIWMMSYHCKRRMRKSARMQRLLWMRLRRSSARLMAGL